MSDQYDAAAPLIQVALDTDEAVGNSLAALTRALLRVVRAINGNIVIQLGDTAAATKISVLKSNGSEAFWFKSDGTSSISPGGTPVTGSGTLNKLPYWTSSSALGDSILSQSGSTLTVADNIALTGTVDGVDVSDFYAQRGAVNGLALLDASARLVSTHFPALTGDITTTAGALATTLATVNANVGTFGSTTQSVQVTVNAKGLITAISNQTIAAGVGGSGTSGTIAKFTAGTTLGNSIITESGAAISVAGTVTVVGSSNVNQLIVKGHSTQTAAQIVIQSNAGAEWLSIRGLANGSVLIGKEAGPSLTSADSIAIGYRAMNGVTSSNSVAIGTQALEVMNTSGHSNIAIGYWALKQLTSGLYSVAVGEEALYSITTGINCLGLGTGVGRNVTGSGNVGIGAFAMYYTSTGTDSVYIGTSAGMRVNGTGVTMIGTETGQGAGSTFSISYSTYIGYRSGYNGSTLGNYNTGVGAETLQKNVANATAVGYKAGNVQTGAGFTAIGYQAGLLSTSGTNSTLIGSGAGASLTTNGGAVMIGYQAGNAETAANKLYIANSSTTTPLIYGDFSTPSLTFNGTVNIADAKNVVFGTTTGSKLGSGATEKLGAWGATPIVQPTTAVAAATFVANAGTAVNDASTFDGYTIKQVVKALRNIGWLA